jgi:mannitol/fructose-specific phosphotransferase system IIA component (Ntr-type)
MKLSELLRDDVVLAPFQAADAIQTITAMIDHLVRAGRVPADRRQAVLDAVVAREKTHSTGLENGIAIPHASVDVLDEAVAALAVSRAGIPFQSADGQPARLVILLVIPRKAVQKYIRTVAGVAKLLGHSALRDALLAANAPAEILALIRREEEKEQAALGGTA